MILVVQIINWLANILILVVFIWALLGWVLSPWHPVRQALDRIVVPLLTPIRKVLPPLGAFDFSPFVLIIVVQVIVAILNKVLLR
jgi:YggT family protein